MPQYTPRRPRSLEAIRGSNNSINRFPPPPPHTYAPRPGSTFFTPPPFTESYRNVAIGPTAPVGGLRCSRRRLCGSGGGRGVGLGGAVFQAPDERVFGLDFDSLATEFTRRKRIPPPPHKKVRMFGSRLEKKGRRVSEKKRKGGNVSPRAHVDEVAGEGGGAFGFISGEEE